MTESTKTIASLKKAANFTKLAMHQEGPKSFRRGQGALVKVIHKFGEGDKLDKDAAKKILNWRGCDVRAVAKKAADNGYLTIEGPKDGFIMKLTELGTEVVKKRLKAEDKAADEVLSGLTDAEKKTLAELCDKVSKKAEDLGVDYSRIQKRRGRHCGKKCCEGHGKGHERCHHHGPKYVFVFEEGHSNHACCEHHRHHHHGHKHGKPQGPKPKGKK